MNIPEFPSNIKDVVYRLLQEPTLDSFREFMRTQTGEHNFIDFKREWITGALLAKEMLALANSHGGLIVFGVAENEDKTVACEGLSEFKDKAVISNEIKHYISSNLVYSVHDFCYSDSEYKELMNRKFQMLVVDDAPEYIPFLAKKESGALKKNAIYVRRGTSCEIANEEELSEMIKRRCNYIHPLNGEPLELQEHLNQLRILYANIDANRVYYKKGTGSLSALVRSLETVDFMMGEKVVEPNPLYPEETYEQFVSRTIAAKKNKIERVLDLY